MLISQRVVTDPDFLKTRVMKGKYFKPYETALEVKVRIIQAIKILVTKEMMDFSHLNNSTMESILGIKPTFETIAQRRTLYQEYGKMPFDSFLLENETGAVLVEKRTLKGNNAISPPGQSKHEQFEVCMTGIHLNGNIFPIKFLLNVDEWRKTPSTNEDSHLPTKIGFFATEGEAQELINNNRKNSIGEYSFEDEQKTMFQICQQLHTFFSTLLFETLLFVNASNTVLVKYEPTKKELKSVPKVFRPKYTYHVLDIFRTKTEYENIGEVMEFINKPDKEVRQIRAHLVRGHFKRKNGKLFWWNAFMRNRKNAATVGIVDKDYQLSN